MHMSDASNPPGSTLSNADHPAKEAVCLFQELVTRRLVVRRLEASDAEKVFAYRTDPNVLCFQSWEPASPEDVREVLERTSSIPLFAPDEWFQLGIASRETGELVGDCGLHVRGDDQRQVEVGITVASAFQRRGIAFEALNALFNFLFEQTSAHRLFCSVDPENIPCQRLLEKIGMRREGHLVESVWIRGAWKDDVVYAVLRREWQTHSTQLVRNSRLGESPC